MYLEAIDLLVMKCMGAYDGIGTKEFPARTAQAGVGGEWSVFGEPGADGALWNVAMEALAQETLRLGERVAEVERGGALEDDFQQIGSVLSGCTGEAVETFGALEDLQYLQTVAALPFLDGVRTAAGWTDWVLFCSGD